MRTTTRKPRRHEVKHSAGPWTHDGVRLGDGYESAYVKTDRPYPNEQLICKLAPLPPDNGAMDLGEDITIANARLIAAAPDLFAAGREVVKLYGTDHPEGLVELKAAVQRLRAAIRKATGA